MNKMSYDLKKTINHYWNNNFSFKTIYFQRFRPKRKNLFNYVLKPLP